MDEVSETEDNSEEIAVVAEEQSSIDEEEEEEFAPELVSEPIVLGSKTEISDEDKRKNHMISLIFMGVFLFICFGFIYYLFIHNHHTTVSKKELFIYNNTKI